MNASTTIRSNGDFRIPSLRLNRPVFSLVVGALPLISPLQRVVSNTWVGPMRLGVVSAFVVATLPFHISGMPRAFWAMLVGAAVAIASEHLYIVRRSRSNCIRL